MIRGLILLLLWAALAARIYHASLPLLIAALLWALGLGFFYWNLERSGKPDRARFFYFGSLALFFLLGLHLRGFETSGGPSLQPYCHLSLAGNMLSIGAQQVQAFLGGTYGRYGVLGLGLLWLSAILVCGGGFCSRICFFGGWDDAFSRILKKPFFRLPSALSGTRLREFQLAFLLFLVFMTYSRGESEFCLWICPFKSPTGEILDPASSAYAAQRAVYIAVAALFVVILPLLTRKRTFCSTLCPFGALPPLIQKWMPYQVKINPEACNSCGLCVAQCPSFAIETLKKQPAQPTSQRKDLFETRITRYCTLCARCLPSCPKEAISIETMGRKGSALLNFISMGFGGALSLFYVPPAVMALAELVKGFFK